VFLRHYRACGSLYSAAWERQITEAVAAELVRRFGAVTLEAPSAEPMMLTPSFPSPQRAAYFFPVSTDAGHWRCVHCKAAITRALVCGACVSAVCGRCVRAERHGPCRWTELVSQAEALTQERLELALRRRSLRRSVVRKAKKRRAAERHRPADRA
jgi:hypothetical protein